jgi:hypothetical protein
METFSLYRGQALTGIGEGPDRPTVHHGEQFLAADEPLDRDAELLAAARPWMTLDWQPADEQALGQTIEAWSYFPYGNLRFVVRLAAAGLYDRRAAYFAHGRAFPVGAFAGACDPGAWLGGSQAFDEPWSGGERPAPRPPGEPELVRPADVLAEPAVAAALLAHLYQGLVGGYPVVMAVPVKDFVKSGPLHALVSFARAALPLHWKLDCRIRVFTRLPELFLRHLGADLLVIPENEAANALAARREATLLDRTGARREGREYSREAGLYADAVLRRFLRAPGELLAFSGAVSEHLPKDRLPAENEIARVPAIYLLLATSKDPSIFGEWIKSSLLKNLSEQPTGLPWDRLIRPEDWQSLSPEDLYDIVLARAPGKEAQAIGGLAKAEAFRRKLFSPDALQKRWDGDQLAAAASRDPQIAADLARAISDGAFSGDRVLQLLESAEIRDLLETSTLLAHAGADAPLGRWLDRRIESDPRETVTALLRRDRWRQWRIGASSLPGGSLRKAALAWLASEAWQDRPAPAKRLEDWKQIVEDLGSLSGKEIADLRTGASKRFPWPWITPFQDVQLRDLCRLAGNDLGALTELAEGIDPQRDLRYRFEGSLFEHVLAQADPALREGLPAKVLSFLSNPQGAVLAPGEAVLLFKRTMHRRNQAAAGLRRSIEVFLDRDPVAALQAAEQWLSETDDPGLIKVLQLWQKEQPPIKLTGEVGVLLERLLPAEGKVSRTGRGVAALDPAIQALLQGSAENGCWKKLAEEINRYIKGARTDHPVSRLAAGLREVYPHLQLQERQDLEERGWRTFAAAAGGNPALLRQPHLRSQPLPALEVSALLRPREGLGRIALSLASLNAARDHIRQELWWESLLAGLACNRWGNGLRDPRDREEAALMLIHQEIPDLLPMGGQILEVQDLIGDRMEKLYFKRGIPLARNLIPRAASRAGAAS